MRLSASWRTGTRKPGEKGAGTMLPAHPVAPGRRRRRGFMLTAGAAAATAIACGIGATAAASTAAARSRPSFGAAARSAAGTAAQALLTESRAGHARTAQSPATLAAGQVGTRSQVPWKLVGPGWMIAEFTTGNYRAARPVTLYLIDPAGGRYRVYRWPAGQAWQLIGWSGDKARVLLEAPGGRRLTLHQLVLATGHVTTFRLPAAADVLGYTRPDGDNVLVSDHGIVRFSLTGVLQARLIRGTGYESALSAASGRTEIVTGGTGVELVSNAGGIIRRLPVPGADAKLGGCAPVRWWNPATALVSCMPATGEQRLWAVPVSGTAPTAVTALRNGSGPDYGDLEAWDFPSGRYVDAQGACGTIFIGKQAANGGVSVVSVPGSSGNNIVVATSGAQMLVREFTECYPASSLVWFNPAAGTVRNVLHAPANGTGVLSVVAYNRNGQQPGDIP